MDNVDQALLARHMEWMRLKDMAASTIGRRRAVIGWVAETLDCPLLQATAPQLCRWRAGLAVAPNSVSVYVSQVTQFYRWVVNEGLLAGSPAVGLPTPRRSRRLPRPISEDDLMFAVRMAPRRIRPWLVLAGWAGLRAKEIALLHREAVLDTRFPPGLLIEQSATKGHDERLVPMSEFVLAELVPVLPRHGWVFVRLDGRPGPNTPGRVSHMANTFLHECGIGATLHQFRHRFATQMYQRSDLRTAQEVLGHRSMLATMGYTAYSPQAAVAAVEAIPVPARLQAAS